MLCKARLTTGLAVRDTICTYDPVLSKSERQSLRLNRPSKQSRRASYEDGAEQFVTKGLPEITNAAPTDCGHGRVHASPTASHGM